VQFGQEKYQLGRKSQIGILGFSLELFLLNEHLSSNNTMKQNQPLSYYIWRDSLTKKQISQLSQTLRKLAFEQH
jgi:hypothetical protein